MAVPMGETAAEILDSDPFKGWLIGGAECPKAEPSGHTEMPLRFQSAHPGFCKSAF